MPPKKLLKPSQGKATNAEIELRVQTVIKMTIQGYSRAEIVRYGSNKWKIGDRQMDDYVAKAKDGIKEIASPDKDDQRAKSIARKEDLYQKAYKNSDWARCESVSNSLDKLLGLNEPVKTESDVNLKNFKVTDLIGFQ